VHVLLLLLGVFACSTSVIWIKKCDVDPVLLTALRLAIAAAVLTPLFVRDWLRNRERMSWRLVCDSAIPGLVLALHFFLWIHGARLTPAVNSTLLVNLVPIVMPFLLIWLASEKLYRKEIFATLIASLGLGVIFVSDYQLSREHFRGDVICLASMLFLALYLALGRRFRHHPTVWLYLVPLYYAAALASFIAVPLLAESTAVDWSREWPWVLALGIVPTVFGHSLLNNAMRQFRGQIVSLASMLQFVFAGVMAYLLLPNETPGWSFYPASALIVAAGVIVVRR
jgi:drug/metabolite transporter (DMT)-like permease